MKPEIPQIALGSHVRVKGQRTVYDVLEGPNRKGELLVASGNLRFWVVPGELEPAEKQKSKKTASADNSAPGGTKRIDLHGLTVVEALETVESAIDMALSRGGVWRIEVMHGLGSGKLQSAVTRYLSESRHISSFKLDTANPGVTIVFI